MATRARPVKNNCEQQQTRIANLRHYPKENGKINRNKGLAKTQHLNPLLKELKSLKASSYDEIKDKITTK